MGDRKKGLLVHFHQSHKTKEDLKADGWSEEKIMSSKKSDRIVKFGELEIRISNVPDDISERELKNMALMKLLKINALRTCPNVGKAS
jgi:hypothetical protein